MKVISIPNEHTADNDFSRADLILPSAAMLTEHSINAYTHQHGTTALTAKATWAMEHHWRWS